MRPTVTDRVAWSVRVVSPAKTAESIEMPFGLWARVVPRNHVLDGGSSSPHAKGQLGERTRLGMPDDTAVSSAKMAEPIKMPLGLRTRIGPGKDVLHGGGAHWRHLANTTEQSMCGAMRLFVKLL